MHTLPILLRCFRSFARRVLPFGLLVALLFGAPAGALPRYDIVALGLFDAEHTSSSGGHISTFAGLGDSGTAAGTSSSFQGNASFGLSAWYYDGATVFRLGYLDATHTRDDGYRVSSSSYFGAAGFVAGSSERYAGSERDGWSAWRYDGSTTVRIGLFDAEHTASDGQQDTNLFGMNDSGAVVGTSRRYDGNVSRGLSAWLYDGVGTTQLGFVDGVHVADDGFRASAPLHVTNSGFVAGHSTRFEGGPLITESAWLYDGASTTRVGFWDAAHTAADGSQDSRVHGLTEAGFAFGISARAAGGLSAWVYDGAAHTRVGLVDAAHTQSDGRQDSVVWYMNDSGHAAGYSWQYSGGGQSSWFFDGTETVRIGLVDADHTNSNGGQVNIPNAMNAAGLVLGSSERYGYFTGEDVAQSAWLFDGTTTTRLGLLDALHTRSDGFQESGAIRISDAGLVAGYSARYDGSSSLGQTAWIYDASTGEHESIVLSTRSDGAAWSSVSFLDESGFALGSYSLFDESDQNLGSRVFAWTSEEGAVDLGFFVGDLDDEGWSHLAFAYLANDFGQILGLGAFGDHSGQHVFLLTPIPEPGTAALLLAGLLGIAARGRRAESRSSR